VGVDISQGAVDVYNEAVSNQGLSPDEMRAVCAELKGEAGELDDLKFDVVAVSYRSKMFSTGCRQPSVYSYCSILLTKIVQFGTWQSVIDKVSELFVVAVPLDESIF